LSQTSVLNGGSSLCCSGLGQVDAVTSIGASGLYDMKRIGEWAKQSRLDPNDPKNASIRQLLEVSSNAFLLGEITAPEYFRLEHLQEEFNFVTDEELDKSKRFRLLRLRNQGVKEFRNYKFIPAYEHEIPDNVFEFPVYISSPCSITVFWYKGAGGNITQVLHSCQHR
uniref:Uncharacterized protein n=1 Tax=Oryzias latipes TaxID=8090 RepID=A0A3P9I9S0_ORYLA